MEAARQQYEKTLLEFTNVSQQLNALRGARERNKLTIRELSSMPDGVSACKSIGRMFVKAPLAELREEIADVTKQCSLEVTKLEQLEAHLQRMLESQQNALKSLIQQEQQQSVAKTSG